MDETSQVPPVEPQVNSTITEVPMVMKKSTRWGWLLVGLLVVVAVAVGAYAGNMFWLNRPTAKVSETTQIKATPTPEVSETIQLAETDCGVKSTFADRDLGMQFCYPTSWGKATIVEAKVDSTDTGYRQSITFSTNPLVSVGGVSQDWSTTKGRGVGCLEPNNTVPAVSTYNTAWHDIQGEGMAVDFATRSLPSVEGGYDLTESTNDLVGPNGVCVQGHKEIGGTRYKIAFIGFSHDFSEAAGIASPKAHMDNPNVLFSLSQRSEVDAVLASLTAY